MVVIVGRQGARVDDWEARRVLGAPLYEVLRTDYGVLRMEYLLRMDR